MTVLDHYRWGKWSNRYRFNELQPSAKGPKWMSVTESSQNEKQTGTLLQNILWCINFWVIWGSKYLNYIYLSGLDHNAILQIYHNKNPNNSGIGIALNHPELLMFHGALQLTPMALRLTLEVPGWGGCTKKLSEVIHRLAGKHGFCICNNENRYRYWMIMFCSTNIMYVYIYIYILFIFSCTWYNL